MSQRFILNQGIRADLARDLNLNVVDRRIFEVDPNRRIFDPNFRVPGPTAPAADPVTPDTGASDRAAPGDTVVHISVRVQPGDLITADLINFILARLDLLESRPAPVPTVPTVTRPTITPTFTPTLTFVPTLTATVFPTTIRPTLDPRVTIGPTLVATFDPRLTIGPPLVATLNPVLDRAVVPEDPVRVLPGVGAAEEGLLRNAGIADIRAVADADPVRIADTLRLQPNEAANLVGHARIMLGRIR